MKRTVYLISCAKSQREGGPWKARDLYSPSPRFRKLLAYAQAMTSDDNIFVLSTKHHLLHLDDKRCQYDQPPATKKEERVAWAKEVMRKMTEKGIDPQNTKFVIFFKATYCEELIPHLPPCDLPLKGLKQGPGWQRLNEMLLNRQKEMCGKGKEVKPA